MFFLHLTNWLKYSRKMKKNRERLLQKFSTAEKENVRVLYVGNHPKSGKTVNIHGKICH